MHTQAKRVLPGGNTRSVLYFDPFPFRVESAAGQRLVDIDGHSYIDFCGNYTAALLGHSPDRVKAAVSEVLEHGWALGATHPREVELAELICDRFGSIDQVRFTNSGTEANLMAIGTALHHQQIHGENHIRETIGVFDQAYHGGVLAFGDIDGPHNPLNVPHDFRVAPFGDVNGLDELFQPDLACVLVEPVQGSAGCRPPEPGFLNELRSRCDDTDTILIFDEVMTSRLGPGGAQQRFDVLPDMTTLGKYLAGGMTFGAFGGRRDIMAGFDPDRPGALTQAGTFNNNIVSMTAAITTLRHELDADTLGELNERGDRLRQDLQTIFDNSGSPLWVTGVGSMLCVHGDDSQGAGSPLVELYFHAMLDQGLYLAPRGFMALSKAVTDDDCAQLVAATRSWVDDLPSNVFGHNCL